MKGLKIICVMLLIMVASCASHNELHRSRSVEADTLAAQSKQDTQIGVGLTRIDSILNVFLEHSATENTSSEQSQETISEIITTIIDSLGRENRTEQRTINRSMSRDEQLRQELWQQQMFSQIQALRFHYDSLLCAFESKMEAHSQQADSTSTKKDVGQTAGPSWWQRLKDKIFFTIVVIVLIAAIWLTRNWWKNL